MPNRSQDRRTDRATADEVAEVERQLWEFTKRIDPPGVPEAKLRPGAFLYRVHRTWHSLGRGTGGLASRSFRALRDELLSRDPPVRNLQPKLYGTAALSFSDAEQLIDVILGTWHLQQERRGHWQARPLILPGDSEASNSQDREAIRENLLHTLFKGDDQLLLEEPVGVPPEIFYEQRGRLSEALIIPTKGETTAHFSPSNAYGGFSAGIRRFFDAALVPNEVDALPPLVIWVLRLDSIRNNAEFHQSFHSLAVYSACLTNWYFRLSRLRDQEKRGIWSVVFQHSAFVIYGMPTWIKDVSFDYDESLGENIDENLVDLGPEFFVPYTLPIVLKKHHQVKKHSGYDYGINVSIDRGTEVEDSLDGRLRYWLFPDQPKSDLEETAETTGLPVFDAEMSPGADFDLAYGAVYRAVVYHLGRSRDARAQSCHQTLHAMGWKVQTIAEFQQALLVSADLRDDRIG